jgi:hypothetical protein
LRIEVNPFITLYRDEHPEGESMVLLATPAAMEQFIREAEQHIREARHAEDARHSARS